MEPTHPRRKKTAVRPEEKPQRQGNIPEQIDVGEIAKDHIYTNIDGKPDFDPDATVASQVDPDRTVPSKLRAKTASEYNSDVTVPSEMSASKAVSKAERVDRGVLEPGTVIRNRFVVQKTLGAGGMGAVYRALDLRKQEAGDNDCFIAIKLLSGNFQHHSAAFITLQREAKKTQVLAHPNIVTVYDFDRDGDLIYLTMEELDGHSLSDIIKGKADRKLTLQDRYSIIDQLGKGLSYAHSKGIVHSDLKPANIFVTNKGIAKILDFGIARAANEELYEDSFDAGALGALTFAYASLEMIQSEPPHPSDDIYALGIITCELLDGSHPYNRKDAKQVFTQNIKPKKLAIKNPFLRKSLMRSVAIKRADRIPNASQFLREFHRSRNMPKRLTLATLFLVFALTANALYIQTIEPETVPFDSLSTEQQTQFHSFITEGQRALSFGDLQGAVSHLNSAFLIHETHKDFIKSKKEIVNILSQAELTALTEEERRFAQTQRSSLKEYPAFSDIGNETP